jgi:PhoPQ-activated pathogenicity-related protein
MSRSEDEIIAWTWNTFIESKGSDPVVLLRMPMTKVGQINYELPFMSF